MTRRFEESQRLGSLVSSAVLTAIKTRSLSEAMEWLEAGRSYIWAQVLFFRNPLHDLQQQHPDFHRRRRDAISPMTADGEES